MSSKGRVGSNPHIPLQGSTQFNTQRGRQHERDSDPHPMGGFPSLHLPGPVQPAITMKAAIVENAGLAFVLALEALALVSMGIWALLNSTGG